MVLSRFLKISWFQLFKYIIYLLLAVNVYLFFNEEFSATSFRFENGVSLSEIIVAYSATIDTATWVVLLIMFEFETYVIPDEKLKGKLMWFLNGVSVLCYIIIVYSFYAYIQKYLWTLDFQLLPDINSICNFKGQSWLLELDFFEEITNDNCATLSSATEFYGIPEQHIITDQASLQLTKNLALNDVINAAAWLLVVLVLEVDVWMQTYSILKNKIYKLNYALKVIAYSTLLLAAIYWGYTGKGLDFWDAFLWVVAFLFIEMNLFKWQHETEEELEEVKNTE